MEAAVRAFEDWEFSVLEKEAGIDEEEDESAADKEMEGGSEGEVEKEISCQQHVVNTAQVNNKFQKESFLRISQLLPSCYTGFSGLSVCHVPHAAGERGINPSHKLPLSTELWRQACEWGRWTK